MLPPPIPEDDAERLAELLSYSILDSEPELDYDTLVRVCAEICHTPMALITLVDKDRQWFKSKVGNITDSETPRKESFCAHAICDPDNIFVVSDARTDERFKDHPAVVGAPYVAFYAGIPLKSDKGHPIGTLCIIDDKPQELSENQKLALQLLSKQVMSLLELRKKNNQLELALKKLAANNKSLESFAFKAAHDIKSPLNNISALSSYLETHYTEDASKEGKEMLALIGKSATVLRDMVDGMMEHARADQALEDALSELTLHTVFSDMKALFSRSDVTLSFTTNVDSIRFHKSVLEQIVSNLIANAVKYSDKEHTAIQVSFDLNTAQKQLTIAVQDNGPGIPEEHQKQIFELFHKLHEQDRFGQEGTGTGLATVDRLVQFYGGTIEVSSNLGEGTLFTMTFPYPLSISS